MSGVSAVDPLLEKIRRQVVRSRKRLQDFFEDFDRFNHKVITASRASRALDRAGVRLSQDEMDAILREFATSDDQFNYREFCDAVDEVFVQKGLENDPDTSPRHPLSDSQLRNSLKRGEAPVPSEVVDNILRRCRTFVQTRGVVVKEFFRDFDPRNLGRVSREQFQRELARCFAGAGLSDREREILTERYTVTDMDGDGHPDCDYRALHDDCEDPTFLSIAGPPGTTPFNQEEAKPHSPAPNRPTQEQQQWRALANKGADEVLASLIRTVADRRIRLKDAFEDFDPLRSGFMSQSQFGRALSVAGLGLTAAECSLLCRAFHDPARDAVAYRRFVDRVEEAFTARGMEKNPLATVDTESRRIATTRRQAGASDMHPDDRARARFCLTSLADQIAQRCVALKDKFRDFDPRRTQTVTRAQFERVLAIAGLMPGSALPRREDPRLVAMLFTAPRKPDLVHYGAFMREVGADESPPDASVHATLQTSTMPVERSGLAAAGSMSLGGTAHSSTTSVRDLLSRIRQHARKLRMRLDEFFRDADPLRHGHITQAQFAAGIKAACPFLAPLQVATLARHYEAGHVADAGGRPHVSWRAFTDDVDQAFTQKGLEKDPDADVEGKAVEVVETGLEDVSARLSSREENDLRALLRAIALEVKSKRILAKPAFDAFDRFNRGSVTAGQFRRVLTNLGLDAVVREHYTARIYGTRVGDGGMVLLEKAFRTPSVDRTDVNYIWFLGALADPDTVLSSLPGSEDTAARTEWATQTLRHVQPAVDRPAPWSEGVHGITANRSAKVDGARVEDVIERLRGHALTRGIRVGEFFADYDRLRRGTVTRAKFRSALDNAGLVLSEGEYTALMDSMRPDAAGSGDLVRYRSLVRALDGGGEELEKNPTKRVERPSLPKPTHLAREEDVDPDVLRSAVDRLRRVVSERRLMPKPFFEARDKVRQGLVTRAQFKAVLDMTNLDRGLAAHEVETLMDAYRCPRPYDHDKVNYVKFCVAIDDSQFQ